PLHERPKMKYRCYLKRLVKNGYNPRQRYAGEIQTHQSRGKRTVARLGTNLQNWRRAGVHERFAEARDKGREPAVRRDFEVFPRLALREDLTARACRSLRIAFASAGDKVAKCSSRISAVRRTASSSEDFFLVTPEPSLEKDSTVVRR